MSGVLEYWRHNEATIAGWFAWHAWLSLLPVLLGLALALPLGWLAQARAWAYPVVVGTAGVVYTVPSLALFVLLPGVLHTQILDPVNVVAALTLYTAALLTRVVADGLAAVPASVRESAVAMGYRPLGRLVAVDLPVALPVIAAGVRVATVSNVSLVSVASIIGVPELGQLFTTGMQLFSTAPIVLGVLACLLLAVTFDALIVAGTRLLTPWQRSVGQR